MEQEYEYEMLWLCSITQITNREKSLLLAHFGDAQKIRAADARALGKCSFLKRGKVEILQNYQKQFDPQKEYHKWRERGIQFISFRHPGYPQALRQICDYPLGLFFIGELLQRDIPCVAIVGARICTQYGYDQAAKLARRLAEHGVCVVSGLACGIDGAAQRACMEAGGKSYGVLGCGPDICYPSSNRPIYERLKKNGALLSEYPPGTSAAAWRFPARNRIISGLCRCVVVVEAKRKSGSLITADFALEQGRDVYAFPARITDETGGGCNRLIAQGAGIVTDIDEFLEELGLPVSRKQKTKKNNLTLATPEKLLYSCLESHSKSFAEIVSCTEMTVPEAVRAIYALKEKELIRETEKNYYVRN